MSRIQISALVATITLAVGLFHMMSKFDAKSNIENIRLFAQWKNIHQKRYQTPQEHLHRFGVFLRNVEMIKSHNSGNHGFTMVVNKFADLSAEEFVAKYTGFVNPARNDAAENPNFKKMYPQGNVPEEIDWVSKGAVTPVKNQGTCGSCWAFSAVGNLEGLNFINGGKLTSYSEQQLVDCSSKGSPYGNEGCNGGWMTDAIKYVIDNGITTEDQYKYTGKDDTCVYKPEMQAFRVTGQNTVPVYDNDNLKASVAAGPVSVAMDANLLMFYGKGVVGGYLCGHALNHGVVAVGYGIQDGKKAWKAKNSWGSNWGMQGYFFVERLDGVKKAPCGFSDAASYATL